MTSGFVGFVLFIIMIIGVSISAGLVVLTGFSPDYIIAFALCGLLVASYFLYSMALSS